MLYPLSYGGSRCASSVHDLRVPIARTCARRAPLASRPVSGGRLGRRRYPWAVTPEQLSDSDRRRPDRARGRRRARAARRRAAARWSSSGRRARSTATTPPTSRCSWPSRPASRRATSPACSPSGWRRPTASRRSTSPGPGFLNIRVEAGAQGVVAAQVVAAGCGVRRDARPLAGTRFNVEFISANPTGPIHLGHTRWAVVGDAIARVLEAAGAEVDPRVLHQRPRQPDGQVRRVARGGRAGPSRCPRTATTATTSHDLAQQIVEENPHIVDLPEGERLVAFREAGYKLQLAEQQAAARRRSGRDFDVWYSERSLHDGGRGSSTGSRGCASRGTSSRPTARCGCAPPTSATTRTGCWCAATAS